MTYSFGDISAWGQRILLNFCWVSIFFDILIANISWKVAQTSINYIIFWKSVMRTFRCIYVNCCNRLGKIGKNAVFCLRAITQEGNMETRQMTSFLFTFSTQTVYNIYFGNRIHFYVVPLWSILVCNIPQFWEKATNLDSLSYFSRK